MKARAQIELTFELGNPEDYHSEVNSWEGAADSDLGTLSVMLGYLDCSWMVTRVDIEGSDEFIRLEGDDQEGECRE